MWQGHNLDPHPTLRIVNIVLREEGLTLKIMGRCEELHCFMEREAQREEMTYPIYSLHSISNCVWNHSDSCMAKACEPFHFFLEESGEGYTSTVLMSYSWLFIYRWLQAVLPYEMLVLKVRYAHTKPVLYIVLSHQHSQSILLSHISESWTFCPWWSKETWTKIVWAYLRVFVSCLGSNLSWA